MKIFRPQGVHILGTGHYLPETVIDNAELIRRGAPLEPEEIVKLCGIRERRYAAPEQATSDLAIAAARQALEGLDPDRVDRVLLGTVSPDHPSPSTACVVQEALGLRKVPAMDLGAACSSFLYGLDLATRAIATGEDAVLTIAADIRSRFIDPCDRGTCALFGDGAGAAVLGPGEPGKGIVAIGLLADGRGAKSVYVPAGGSRAPATEATVAQGEHTIRMTSGPQVYLAAVEGMLGTAKMLLDALDLGFEDIAKVIPHQPNKRILDRMARLAKVPAEKIHVNIERVGNISGATVAVGLDEVRRSGAVQPGDKVLLLAAGAGYTAGAALWVVE